MKIAGIVAAVVSFTLAVPASAQPSQASLVNAMRTIGAAWERIARNGEVFITQCPGGGFSARRLAPGSSVSIDLRQTNSLINPYIGIVSITGEFQNNENGSCYSTVQAAQSGTPFHGNDMTYDFQLTYHSDGKALSLANADPRFMNNGGNAMMRVTAGTHPDWSIVFTTPLQ